MGYIIFLDMRYNVHVGYSEGIEPFREINEHQQSNACFFRVGNRALWGPLQGLRTNLHTTVAKKRLVGKMLGYHE